MTTSAEATAERSRVAALPVEDKGLSLSYHYRGAEDEQRRDQREDERVGNPAFGPVGKRERESRDHESSEFRWQIDFGLPDWLIAGLT